MYPKHTSIPTLAYRRLLLPAFIASLSPSLAHCFSQGSSSSSLVRIRRTPQQQRTQTSTSFPLSSTTGSNNDTTTTTSTMNTWKLWTDGKPTAISQSILPLASSTAHHKGSAGRIAVVGGSRHYTGAPYYAATAALRVGADLATVLCAAAAAVPIKSYGPELMVLAVYTDDDDDDDDNNQHDTMVTTVVEQLQRVHCLVVGPGLGRNPRVLRAVGDIVVAARQRQLPLVLDADALFALVPSYQDLLKGYDKLILTPNQMEYRRMVQAEGYEEEAWSEATIIQKGCIDKIVQGSTVVAECHEEGSLKRPGGIGDVLAGVTATLVAWQAIMAQDDAEATTSMDKDRLACSCWTACCLVKRAASSAFQKHHRAMNASHILDEIGPVFREMMDE